MPAKRAIGLPLPDPFVLEETTLAWMARRYPQVDPEIAAERYSFWAVDYLFASHQRAFQNFLTREADNNKLGPMLKKLKPKTAWDELLADADRLGFRRPNEGELLTEYRAQIDRLRSSNVTAITAGLGAALKRP